MLVRKWARMRVWSERHDAPPSVQHAIPSDRALACFAALVCLSLWMTSTEVRVTSAERDDGRVVACRYFTGTRVVERQYAVVAGEAGRHACPLVKAG